MKKKTPTIKQNRVSGMIIPPPRLVAAVKMMLREPQLIDDAKGETEWRNLASPRDLWFLPRDFTRKSKKRPSICAPNETGNLKRDLNRFSLIEIKTLERPDHLHKEGNARMQVFRLRRDEIGFYFVMAFICEDEDLFNHFTQNESDYRRMHKQQYEALMKQAEKPWWDKALKLIPSGADNIAWARRYGAWTLCGMHIRVLSEQAEKKVVIKPVRKKAPTGLLNPQVELPPGIFRVTDESRNSLLNNTSSGGTYGCGD